MKKNKESQNLLELIQNNERTILRAENYFLYLQLFTFIVKIYTKEK